MSFEVFRRHQRKLLAIFAILAMFGFVVSDSLPRLMNSNSGSRDQQIVKLYGRMIYQSDLSEILTERRIANQFVSRLIPYFGPEPFGSLRTRELVDALILRHEADRLGIPAGPQAGKEFLKQITQGRMNRDLFDFLMTEFNNQVDGDQVLAAIADQVRLRYVRGTVNQPGRLLGAPMITPYDVFRAYRDENEKVSARVVEVPVEKFLAKVPEPSEQELRTFYDAHKDELPDPTRPSPGFKIPRQVQLEVLSVDGNAKARAIKDQLTEAELRTAYENRKAEFELKPGPGDLPVDLFAGAPELTPPIVQSFADVRGILASSLAEDKAQAEIVETFEKIKQDVLDKFFDEYQEALSKQEDARGQGGRDVTLPQPPDLKAVAKSNGLVYELTPMLSLEDAEHYGTLATAQVGLSRQRSGRTFTDEFFDPRTGLYESVELTDQLGTRYLARKIKDAAPRVPPLDEVRSQVALAWKTDRARPIAKRAAEELAEQLKKQPGTVKDGTFQGYRVMTIPAIPRMSSPTTLALNPFEPVTPQETPISEVSYPGQQFRKAYFNLEPGSAPVVTNQPETTYYAMLLERRDPATFAALYAPNGEDFRYRSLTRDQADRRLIAGWMDWLRHEAGIPADWMPADEAKEKENVARNRG